jgi:dihydrofolate reductase
MIKPNHTVDDEMKISLIVAMTNNRVIGNHNKLPWHISADLKRFKTITLGSFVLMGRKTFESIGKPLPERTNIILSSNGCYRQSGCLVFNSLDKAMEWCRHRTLEVFVIGGYEPFQISLPLADSIFITLIHKTFTGDTFFPDIDMNDWVETEREDIHDDCTAGFSYSFLKLERQIPQANCDNTDRDQ